MLIHGARPRSEPEVIKTRLSDLSEGFQFLTEIMHGLDGTQPGNPMGGREMQVAKQYLDTAWLWAKEAVEQS
jgi:hypothetical protein